MPKKLKEEDINLIKVEKGKDSPDKLTRQEAENLEGHGGEESSREVGGAVGGAILGGAVTLGPLGALIGGTIGYIIIKIAKDLEDDK